MDIDEADLRDALDIVVAPAYSNLLNVPEAKELSQTSSALSYSAYLSKPRPAASPVKPKQANTVDPASCLAGLSFVVTGEFDQVARTKVEQLVRDHGGRLVGNMSKLVNILVAGRILSTGLPTQTSKKY
jgi:NAD-dependent DNA ligase